MIKYYSVFGTNGCGVVTSWERVNKARNYLRSFNCRLFDNFVEAEAYSLEKLWECIAKSHLMDKCIFPEYLELQKLIFISHLIKRDEPEKKLLPLIIKHSKA